MARAASWEVVMRAYCIVERNEQRLAILDN
jgi:hypothetical protein